MRDLKAEKKYNELNETRKSDPIILSILIVSFIVIGFLVQYTNITDVIMFILSFVCWPT